MDTQTTVITKQDVKIPNLYTVIIHNDDTTTMEFVVEILVSIFQKEPVEAAALMMEVHEKGSGIAGVYPYDIACTKKGQTDQRSVKRGFPLKVTIREVQ